MTDQRYDGGIESRAGRRLHKLYGRTNRRLVRDRIRARAIATEGGEVRSITLRRIMRDYHGVDVGMYTYGACFAPFAMDPNTTIGRYSSIAATAACFGANHPMNAKSSHPIFYNPLLGETEVDLIKRTHLTIGSDVWMGHNSVVLNSVKSIGDGAVIGAGAVVVSDVPAYAIVVGQPAKLVRHRFPPEIIEDLVSEQWWDKSIEELKTEGIEKFQVPLTGDVLK